MSLQLPREHVHEGVQYELEIEGDYETEYGILPRNRWGDANHPAHAQVILQMKYALTSSLIEQRGSVPSSFYNTTTTFEIRNCGTYMYALDFTGLFGPVTTTQVNGGTLADTIFLQQLAPYRLITRSVLKFGASCAHDVEETGTEWILLYNHINNSDQRLNEQVVDGTDILRANLSRRAHAFSVPMYYDCFQHTGRALRVCTMRDTPPELELQLADGEMAYHRTGTAGGDPPSVNFAPGTLTNVRLRGYYIQLPNVVEQAVISAGTRRITYWRKWQHARQIKPNTTDDFTMELPNMKGTVTAFFLRPENSQFHGAYADRLTLAGQTDNKRLDIANHFGAWFTDGTASYQREPFSGVQLWVGNGKLRWNLDWLAVFCRNPAQYFIRSPTLPNERVALIPHEFEHRRFNHRAGVALGGTHKNTVTLYHAYGGMTSPAWGGYMKVSWLWETIFVTQDTRAWFIW